MINASYQLLNAGALLPNESYRLLNVIWHTITSSVKHLRITPQKQRENEQPKQTIITGLETHCNWRAGTTFAFSSVLYRYSAVGLAHGFHKIKVKQNSPQGKFQKYYYSQMYIVQYTVQLFISQSYECTVCYCYYSQLYSAQCNYLSVRVLSVLCYCYYSQLYSIQYSYLSVRNMSVLCVIVIILSCTVYSIAIYPLEL